MLDRGKQGKRAGARFFVVRTSTHPPPVENRPQSGRSATAPQDISPMKPIFWRMLRRVMLIAVALPLVALAFQAVLRHTGNFHEVIAGELYRSAQPSAEMLRREAARFGIRTVVNLRGAHPGKAWYEEERQTAEELGITFIDFPMSANRELPVERAHELITRLRDVPKPILIHCYTGADRTGLASVIYVNRIAGVDEETAERQLSMYFGHFGIPILSSTFAMDESWEKLEIVFGIPDS
jgi:protein tyrosine/serine phosphatase